MKDIIFLLELAKFGYTLIRDIIDLMAYLKKKRQEKAKTDKQELYPEHPHKSP